MAFWAASSVQSCDSAVVRLWSQAEVLYESDTRAHGTMWHLYGLSASFSDPWEGHPEGRTPGLHETQPARFWLRGLTPRSPSSPLGSAGPGLHFRLGVRERRERGGPLLLRRLHQQHLHHLRKQHHRERLQAVVPGGVCVHTGHDLQQRRLL